MITLVIADDHQLFRHGLASMLLSQPDLEIVGQAADGRVAVDMVREFAPDILLLDLTIPKLHGLDVLAELKGQRRTKVLIISMHRDEASVLEAFRLGARGYLTKDCPAETFVSAIRQVASGELALSPEIRAFALPYVVNRARQVTTSQPHELTRRERMVLLCVAEGKANAETAKLYSISERTVEKHRASALKKLGLKTTRDVLLYAIRHGLIQP